MSSFDRMPRGDKLTYSEYRVKALDREAGTEPRLEPAEYSVRGAQFLVRNVTIPMR